jgi:hypothetical protein
MDRRPSLILCGDLVRAVRRESVVAICHWWGVGRNTVWTWRKALGIDRKTKGTSELHRRWALDTLLDEDIRRKMMGSLKSPERAAKIAASRRGKPMPEKTRKAIYKANKGRKHTAEARRKISEASRNRVSIWKPEEDAMLGTMKDKDVGKRIGKSEGAVSARRYVVGVAAFTERKPTAKPTVWTPAKGRLLGTMPDGEAARKLCCSPMAVFYQGKRLNIAAFRA